MVKIRKAELTDLPQLLEIYNYAVRNLTATFDLDERTLVEGRKWFDLYKEPYPLIVADIDGEAVGYSSLSPFNPKRAYSTTAEISLYVSPHHQGKGIGKKLMESIIHEGRKNNFHNLVSRITAENTASIKLHECFGFSYAGRIKEVGFKFGRWQDVCFYQLIIPPIDE